MTVAGFLQVRSLSKSFGNDPVLRDVNLELGEGEVVALLGLSGSGKTTALRIIAGLETADRGSVIVDGEDVTELAASKRRFAMVFQHYALFPHMTVGDNVAFGLHARGTKRKAIPDRVAEVLEAVDLGGFEGRKVTEISGGQQQRVALARALATRPRLLLLDEPLSNLDPSLRERTRSELRAAIVRSGITTVLVTHEQEEAFDLGDRVAVLAAGRLEQIATPEDLYRAPTSRFVAGFVGRANVLDGQIKTSDGGRVEVELEAGLGVVWSAVAVDEPAAGSRVELVVRPEALAIVDPHHPQAVTGKVVGRRFTGLVTYLQVLVEDGMNLEVIEAEREIAIDESVAVALGQLASSTLVPRAFAVGSSGAPVAD